MDVLDHALASSYARSQLPPPDEARRLRRAAEVSQATIAQLVQVDRSVIAKYERGDFRPLGEHATRYLAVLDRLADYLDEEDTA